MATAAHLLVHSRRYRIWLKRVFDNMALLVALPLAVCCWFEAKLTSGEHMFQFWAQCLALAPGLPGVYVRRAFYRLTLTECASSWYIGFGSFFNHRAAHVGPGIFIGNYALIGSAVLKKECMIGSRASLLSGRYQHELSYDGHWQPADVSRFKQIIIGEHAWIGEAAVIMGDVGQGAMVSAGAVVSTTVPNAVMVAGNPARFVQRLSHPVVPTRSPASEH